MKVFMKTNLILACIFLLLCVGCNSRRQLELLPGITWVYVSEKVSRLTWDKRGVIIEGNILLTCCENGLFISSKEGNKYLDIINDIVKTNVDIDTIAMCNNTVDIIIAIGLYGKCENEGFFSDLKMLRNRINSSVVSEKNKMENVVWGN